MIQVNNLNLKGISDTESVFESELAKGLIEVMQAYDTTASLELDVYSDAPTLVSDAIISGDCTSNPASDNPFLMENTFMQMSIKENLCLMTEVRTKGKRDYWGLDINNPDKTQKLDAFYQKKQSRNGLYSLLKSVWLGNTALIAGDLIDPTLLPNYKLDNGQWTKILAKTPANVIIPQNVAATEALQMTMTLEEALDIVDKMIVKQSKTMRLSSNSSKYIWSTTEIFDVLRAKREKNILAGLTLQNVNTLYGTIETIIYKGIQIINYEHFSQAIRDLKPTTVGRLNFPHRMVLTIGLPKVDFQLTANGNFESAVTPVDKIYKAGTLISVATPEAVNGDFYVTAY